jgi:Terminase large subunit, T4likevirus-type, N-terminal
VLATDLRLALDPDAFAQAARLDGELDDWQRSVLDAGENKLLLCCSRQSGKSTIAALLAARTAVLEPGSLVLCVSPSMRQSSELFRKVRDFYAGLEALPSRPAVRLESALRFELANGSRVVSLPGSERTTRGYSKAALIILDEAARIADELISSLSPMQATSLAGRRRFVAMSTPFGRRGWFFERWQSSDPGWFKVSVPAHQCRRISAEFLDEQERELGPLLFRQEYLCEFMDAAETLFATALVERAFDPSIRPLFELGGLAYHDALMEG